MRSIHLSATSRTRAAGGVLAVALVGLLSFGGIQASHLHRESDERHQRTQILRAVTTEVLALTNISASTTDAQIKAFLNGMTEHLQGEFAPQADAFRKAMVRNKVQSRGRIVAIGLTASSPRSAAAVVAAAASVSNARAAGTQERSYRLSLNLKEVGGRWLVDSMEFVP